MFTWVFPQVSVLFTFRHFNTETRQRNIFGFIHGQQYISEVVLTSSVVIFKIAYLFKPERFQSSGPGFSRTAGVSAAGFCFEKWQSEIREGI